MTSFDGAEVAAVLAAALLGLDDDASVTLEVHLPDGSRQVVERAWHEPARNRLVLDLGGAPPPRRQRTWTQRFIDELDLYGMTTSGVESSPWRTPGARSPLRRVVRDNDEPPAAE